MEPEAIIRLVLTSSAISAFLAGVLALAGQVISNRSQAKRALLEANDAARQRVRDNSAFMMQLIATAHGTPADGRRNLALGEQIAAMELVVANAIEYPALRPAAEAFLRHYISYAQSMAEGKSPDSWDGAVDRGTAALRRLEDALPVKSRVTR